MKALLAGAGARQALRPGARGAVLASFSRACYLDLDLPAGLLALVGAGVHPGPLHVVLDGDVPRIARGTAVAVRDGELLVGRQRVGTRDVQPWWGPLPPPELVRSGAPVLFEVLGEAARGSPLLAMGERASAGLRCLGSGDLEAAGRLLGGLGPGLTPAGDDALAGAMLALRAAAGPAVETALARAAASLPTGPIGLAFLAWAARGQALAPVHDLLAAVVTEDHERAAAVAGTLAGVGASSGADFALGLRSALAPVSSLNP